MKNEFDKLDKVLNTKSDIVNITPESAEIEIVSQSDSDLKKDYEYTRANLYSLVEKGQELINGIMELAGEGGSPRAYEVAFQGIKHISDVTDKIVGLQAKIKEVEENVSKTTNNVTNNALFVGSTAELQKLLKQGFLNNKEKE